MSEPVQPFPNPGVLGRNTDLSLCDLKRRIGKADDPARSYIVKSVKIATADHAQLSFEQCGSGPNFQGGLLTLCTCKHQMRASLDCSEWVGKWIAGFTSRTHHQGRHWLFFLARVGRAYESHFDLWKKLSARARVAKSADTNFLGDVFVPHGDLVGEDRFNPENYRAPSQHAHRKQSCDNGWRNDIRYRHTGRYGRLPALLVGDPKLTFIWRAPAIFLGKRKHCRDFKKWDGVSNLLDLLVES